MSDRAAVVAKVAALHKQFQGALQAKDQYDRLQEYFPRTAFGHLFQLLDGLVKQAREKIPDLYGDLPEYKPPNPSFGSDYSRAHLTEAFSLLDYMLQVHANSKVSVPEPKRATEQSSAVFISHGRSLQWYKVKDFLAQELGLVATDLEQTPNLGRSVFQKLQDEAKKCGAAIIVMTGDDQDVRGKPQARQNVMHEIGFLQAALGPSRVCILYEEGTEIPSNIHGIVYIPFPKDYITAALPKLKSELLAMTAVTSAAARPPPSP